MPEPRPKQTPPITHSDRKDFERFLQSGDRVNRLMIELDYAIERIQAFIVSGRGDVTEKAPEFTKFVTACTKEASLDKQANFTDFYRLATSLVFATERAVVPLLFGDDSPKARELRAMFANGSLGKSTDGIGDLLVIHDILSGNEVKDEVGFFEAANLTALLAPKALAHFIKSEQARNIRGCIQEQTVEALLNYDENPDFISLPTGYRDDISRGIDLHVYFVDQEGVGYCAPVSVKSSRHDISEAKRRYPNYVVLCADNFLNNNSHMQISRLLAREQHGYPGITREEEMVLLEARRKIHTEFQRQLAAVKVRQVPEQDTESMVDRILPLAA